MAPDLITQARDDERKAEKLLEHTSASAFLCPHCEQPMRVLRTSGRKWHIWRRRECSSCKHRITTKETAA